MSKPPTQEVKMPACRQGAKMPLQFLPMAARPIRPVTAAKQLRDLQPGEEGYSIPTAVVVDGLGSCYLDPNAWIFPSRKGGRTLRVMRYPSGDFHIGMRAVGSGKWRPRNVTLENADLIPVYRVDLTL